MQPALVARAVLTSLAKLGLDDRSFDAVDAHYFYPDGVAGARVAQALGLPLVVSARGSDINLIGDIPFARRAMVGVAHRAQAIVAVSEALRARMIGIGMPPDRIHVLRNGVDTRMFAPAPRAEARKRLGIALDGPLVLGVGNLVAEKGFELLIATLASLPDVRALIVGDGPLRGALQRQAEASVPGRVDFRSAMPQAELRWAYAAADVLALPSLREGWPNVLLEALACGTPVVAADVGGVREIVSAEAPGRVVEGRDPGAWTRAIRSLLSSPPQADQARHYASRFGWDDVVARQCELYESVVRGWSPGARRVEAARVLSHA